MAGLALAPFTSPTGARFDLTRLGFGGASLAGEPDQQDDAAAQALFDYAWARGVRYLDVAPFYGYGLAETRMGRALRGRSRGAYVLSTKVGRLLDEDSGATTDGPEPYVYDYSRDAVMRCFEGSLKRLGVDRVDIVYVHDICGKVHGGRDAAEARAQELMETGGWRALSDLKASGAVGAIGVGVNEWEPCARMLELADPDMFLLAGRYTLLEQEPLNALFPACRKRGVGVVVGGALNAGALVGGPLYDYAPAPKAIRDRVAAIAEVCNAHETPVVNAALQFLTAQPVVVSILTGAATPAELGQNIDAFLAPAPPQALWAALKTERLLHLDAPTPA